MLAAPTDLLLYFFQTDISVISSCAEVSAVYDAGALRRVHMEMTNQKAGTLAAGS